MGAVRKAYHRAVQIPLDNVERLWQELEAFETGLNKITVCNVHRSRKAVMLTEVQAKKFMADLSPAHMQARTVLRQLQKHLGPLFPPLPPSTTSRPALFIPALPTFNPREGSCWCMEELLKMGREQSSRN
jgi:cleavage stimulation factor subunit 3